MRCSMFVLLALAAPLAQAGVNFTPPTILASGTGDTHSSGSVTTADVDGDGRLDLHVTSGQPSGWFLNRLPAGFEAAPAPFAAAGIQFADLDGDGLLDGYGDTRVFPGDGTQRQSFEVRRGTGGGNFAAAVSFDLGIHTPGDTVIHLHDRDADGDLDLFLFVGPAWTTFRNDGTAFTLSHSGGVEAGFGPGPQLAGDLDADGQPDYVLMSSAVGARRILRGAADGNLTLAPSLLPASEGTTAFWVADVDGDGRQDVLVRRATTAPLPDYRVLLRQGNGSLLESDVLTSDETRRFARAFFAPTPVLADVDGDARPELVARTGYSGCAGPFLCPGIIANPSGFSWLSFSATGEITESAVYSGGLFAFGDVDGDGRTDALGAWSGNVVWRRSIDAPNTAPDVAPEQRLDVALVDDQFNGWLHLGVTDEDQQVPEYRVIDGPHLGGASVFVSQGWLEYRRGRSSGNDSVLVEVDDGAGGVVTTRVVVRVEGIGGGGAPGLPGLAVLGLLLLRRSRRRT